MANTSLKVALILTAVNNIAPVLQQAQRNMATFTQSIKQQAGDFEQYNKKVKQAEDQIKSFRKIQQAGAEHIQAGLLMLAPVEEAARQAAKFEGAMKKVETANFDAAVPLEQAQKMMEELRAQATKLGGETVFSNLEAAQAQNMLLRNGMEYIDVMNGGAQAAMYLAQTAEVAPTAAADAISQITNMYKLQGDQLMFVADQVNRAANASSAGVQDVMRDLQQAGMSAHTLGLGIKDTAMMLGTLHNLGLGQSSGSYLNDMLINLDKMTPKAQLALQAMGWLEGATLTYSAAGKAKVVGGENALFNAAGEIKSAEELVKRLRGVLFENTDLTPEDLRDSTGQVLSEEKIEELMGAKNKLEAMQRLKDVFGIQGMRAAIALATPGKGSYEDMVAKAERAKAIQDQVLEWQETLIGKLETLKGGWETLMSESGSPLLQELKNGAQWLADLTGKVTAFTNTHPQVAKWALKLLAWGAAIRILSGAFMWLFGGMGSFITGAGMRLLSFTRYVHGFYDTFKYFRTGAGIFRSLWAAVSFGYPALTKIHLGTKLAAAGTRAWAAAQQVLNFVMGMNPIMRVIMLIAGLVTIGVALYKNFDSVRNMVDSVWEKFKERFPGAAQFVEMVGQKVGALWDKLKGFWKWLTGRNSAEESPTSVGALRAMDAYASGGILTRPHLGLVAEAGPEAIIPLSARMKGRALALYEQTGRMLGVPMHATGGIFGSIGGITLPGGSDMVGRIKSAMNYIATPTPGPALAMAGGGGSINVKLVIEKIVLKGSGKPDYDARVLAERLGPELENWFKRRGKYNKSRSPRGEN